MKSSLLALSLTLLSVSSFASVETRLKNFEGNFELTEGQGCPTYVVVRTGSNFLDVATSANRDFTTISSWFTIQAIGDGNYVEPDGTLFPHQQRSRMNILGNRVVTVDHGLLSREIVNDLTRDQNGLRIYKRDGGDAGSHTENSALVGNPCKYKDAK